MGEESKKKKKRKATTRVALRESSSEKRGEKARGNVEGLACQPSTWRKVFRPKCRSLVTWKKRRQSRHSVAGAEKAEEPGLQGIVSIFTTRKR